MQRSLAGHTVIDGEFELVGIGSRDTGSAVEEATQQSTGAEADLEHRLGYAVRDERAVGQGETRRVERRVTAVSVLTVTRGRVVEGAHEVPAVSAPPEHG